MAEKGWIYLHRQIQDCSIWLDDEPFDRRSAWVDLLLLANHRDKEIIFNGHPIVIQRGQYLTSVRKLAERWRWGKDRTLRYLRLLEELQMIKRESDTHRTLLTIEKYSVYQVTCDSNEDSNKDTHEDSDKDTHKPQTINEIKEINNKYINKASHFDDPDLDSAFNEYKAMRKKIKAPLTDKAEEMAVNKLKSLSNGDKDLMLKIINQTLFYSWKGFFPLKDDSAGSKPKKENSFNQMMHSDYNMEEIERQLLANG